MTTVLLYLVIAAAIGLVVFAVTVLLFGRGEQMAALSPRVSPAELPDAEVTADDVRKVRFALALRGYRMSDVDWTLERVADEITRLRAEIATLRGADPDVWPYVPGRGRPTGDVPGRPGATRRLRGHGDTTDDRLDDRQDDITTEHVGAGPGGPAGYDR